MGVQEHRHWPNNSWHLVQETVALATTQEAGADPDDNMGTELDQQLQALLSIEMQAAAQATGNDPTNLGQARNRRQHENDDTATTPQLVPVSGKSPTSAIRMIRVALHADYNRGHPFSSSSTSAARHAHATDTVRQTMSGKHSQVNTETDTQTDRHRDRHTRNAAWEKAMHIMAFRQKARLRLQIKQTYPRGRGERKRNRNRTTHKTQFQLSEMFVVNFLKAHSVVLFGWFISDCTPAIDPSNPFFHFQNFWKKVLPFVCFETTSFSFFDTMGKTKKTS